MAFIKKKKTKHHTNNIYQYTVFNSNLFTSNAIENCLLTHTNTHTHTVHMVTLLKFCNGGMNEYPELQCGAWGQSAPCVAYVRASSLFSSHMVAHSLSNGAGSLL